jgi:membrane protein DedA with SNARE-associated domain
MVEWATDLIAAGGLVGVFLLMVAENLFPPMPSEAIMPLAGFAAAQGKMPILGVILAGIAGSVTGNAVWFELARAYGTLRTRAILRRHGRWIGLTEEKVAQAEATMRRNGPFAVFIARCMPGVRTAVSIPAGLVELPRRVFYLWTALGTSIWTGGLALAGYLLGEQFHRVEHWAGPVGLAVAAVVLSLIAWKAWRASRRA